MPVRLPLECDEDAAGVVRALRREPYPFALVGRWAGGGAVVGARPVRVARAGEDPFALLAGVPGPVPGAPEGFVGAGWFGWLGYRLGALAEPMPPSPPAPAPAPACVLAYHDHVLRRTPDGRWWLEALDARVAERRLPEVHALLRAPRPMVGSPPVPTLRIAGAGAAGHAGAVADAVERIAAGDLFQANLCLRLETEWGGDPLALFARGVETLAPAYAAVFLRPGGGVVSFSPELFLRRAGDAVHSGPIKGTAPPGGAGALRASAKDAAEHVMIVDLMRNDLGRVCRYGSVHADPEPSVQPHVGVEHLVSTVRGTLRPATDDADLLRATFPPGSVTGAPKVQAMRVIAELEPTAREAYTGALGYVSPAAGLELAVTIRTFEAAHGRLWLGVGGGVVADSNPRAELDEALAKARPLAAAIGTTVDARPGAGAPVPWSGATPRALGPRRERPDPRQGVFETVLVRDGRPVDLDRHVERLDASLRVLYDAGVPQGLRESARSAAHRAGNARLRIAIAPGAAPAFETGPLPAPAAAPLVLAPFVLPGGLGPHKWRDRRLLEALSAAAGGAVPLLVDADGAVLEAAWAAVAVRDGAVLRTPPADGRLLPGIGRGRLLDAGAAVESPLTLEDLAAAGEIHLVSALRTVPATLRRRHRAGGGVSEAVR